MKLFFLCLTTFFYFSPAFSYASSGCPNNPVFFLAFNQKNINKLRKITTQLDNCSETQRDRYRYFTARALYDQLILSKPEKNITTTDYNEILQLAPKFWAALADLGDLSFQEKEYATALKNYERALLDLDVKQGEIPEIKQDKDNIPTRYILELKEKADYARLLASTNNQFIKPIRTRGKLKGMHSFKIRGIEIKDHKYPLYFKYKSAKLIHNQHLKLLVEVLKNADEPDINITGHTDYIGSDSYNFKLSQERAESLKVFLKNEKKYKGKIKAIGKGEKAIVKMHSLQRKNLSDEQWRRVNRRVEIHLDGSF